MIVTTDLQMLSIWISPNFFFLNQRVNYGLPNVSFDMYHLVKSLDLAKLNTLCRLNTQGSN